MDHMLIERRIGDVTSSTASIVGTAAWCALHAASADAIVAAIAERIAAPSTPAESRAALVYVIHEMILSCVMQATQPQAREALELAIAARLPDAVRRVGAAADQQPFHEALLAAAGWWRKLKVLSPRTLKAITQTSALGRAGGASIQGRGVPPQLQTVAGLLLKYESAKADLTRVERSGGADKEALDAARDTALRRLILLLKAADGRDGPSGGEVGFVAGLLDEYASLQSATAGAPPAMDDKDDILGSFL